MDNVLGIISEYNPFHNGHLYHLEKSKEITNSKYTICVMNGNFTQRGNTSVIDKWTKAEIAILNGIDLVVELPTIYGISSAENFAEGAIKILNSLNIVNTISFGSEIGDINILDTFAKILHEQPKEYCTMLNHELNLGLSFPKARENALLMYLNDIRKYANILSDSNNILGIEYLKALRKYKSNIKAVTIKRTAVNYNSNEKADNFASATGIRRLLNDNKYDAIMDVMPSSSYQILSNKISRGEIVPDISKFEKEIIYNLRKMSLENIKNLPDVSEGLENSLKSAANSCNNINDLLSMVKSKRYTLSRLQRILLYVLLDITKKDIQDSYKAQPYIRVLGFNENGQNLLSAIAHSNPNLNIITSVKKFAQTNTNKILKRMLDIDIFATNIYTLEYEYSSSSNLDFTKKIIKS